MRGRKPKPTAQKVLEGNRGKRPLNDAEPKPQIEIPACPEHIQGAARDEWDRITRALFRMGLVTELDHSALEAHCFAYGQWVEAAKKIIEQGAIRDPNPSAPTQLEFGKKPDDAGPVNWNPWVFHANKSMSQFMKTGVEFGLTPSSRSRLHGAKQEDESERKSEDFLFSEPTAAGETNKVQ